jgi:hypothetical protein
MAYVSYFYIFMEWLFFITKPSFMDSFDFIGIAGSLLIPPLLLFIICAPLIILLNAIAIENNKGFYLSLLISVVVLGSLFFILVDNFIYTMTASGIITSSHYVRFLFLMIYLLLLYETYGFLKRLEDKMSRSGSRKYVIYPLIVMIAASVLMVFVEVGNADWRHADVRIKTTRGELRKPNIIFLASDGVEARYLSIYGYHHETTPFLKEFGRRTLVFENAFANAAESTGSQVSMLCGKHPFELKVGIFPQVLPKVQAFQHLPAILQKIGYIGFQKTLRYYADSGDLNMLGSFNVANGRNLWAQIPGSFAAKFSYLFDSELLFSSALLDRITQRLLHIFAIRNMNNYLALVRPDAEGGWDADHETIAEAIDFIRVQKGPFFMHLHLMGSHHGEYKEARHWFKENDFPEVKNETISHVRYMDAIRDADEHFRKFVQWLEKEGKLANTILIISSDHSQKWSTTERVPLMIFFPGEENKGYVKRNVALMDVVPTVLDYMGVEIPEWMTGRSLIMKQEESLTGQDGLMNICGNKPILTLEKFKYTLFNINHGALSGMDNPGPPLYGVSQVGLILCNHWKKLSLETGEVMSGKVSGHTSPCPDTEIPSDKDVKEFIIRQLKKAGFSKSDW